MIRTLIGLWLIGAVLGGCSNGYYVDLAQVRQQRVAMASGPPPGQPVAMRSPEALPARSTVQAEQVETRSPAVRVDDAKPWPKRDTPEYAQFEVEEAKWEQRIKQVLGSVCRGC